MAKKKTAAFLKKVSKEKALEALHEIESLISKGEVDAAFDLLRNEYRMGPDTVYGVQNRTFLFLLREIFNWTENRSKEDKENALFFIKKYIESGVDVNHQDRFGGTLLHLASWDGYSEVCRLLLENGAKTDIVNDSGRTALDEAIEGVIEGLLQPCNARADESISVLLLGGADPERPFEGREGYLSPLDRVLAFSLCCNPENPEDHPLRKIFFEALDKVRARQ